MQYQIQNAYDGTRRWATRTANRVRARSVILLYHRVDHYDVDPWEISISPQHFGEHLEVLKRHAQPVSLTDLIAGLQKGRPIRRGVAITFDDGYANNLIEAAPQLVAAGIPATFYITTGGTDAAREFWWDELDQLLLSPEPLPDRLHLDIGPGRTWILGEAAGPFVPRGHGISNAPEGSRTAFYIDVWFALRPLPDEERLVHLDAIAAWSGRRPSPRPAYRTMTSAEVRRLASLPGQDIGAHSVTHAHLPSLPEAGQRREIHDSRVFLETLLGRSVATFSYPFTSNTPAIREITRTEGFVAAVGGLTRAVDASADYFELPRFDVKACPGDVFERRLADWFVD